MSKHGMWENSNHDLNMTERLALVIEDLSFKHPGWNEDFYRPNVAALASTTIVAGRPCSSVSSAITARVIVAMAAGTTT
jgi:hypothetical protein